MSTACAKPALAPAPATGIPRGRSPVTLLALLARDIRARVTARRLMVVNGATTGPEGDKQ